MKKISFILSIQLATFLLISTAASSQGFSLTGSLGVANYFGDLTNGSTPNYKPAFSLGAAYDFTNRFRMRLNLSALSVQGDDADSKLSHIKTRNLNFKTSIQEAALLGEFDILDNSFNSIIPYVFVGPSVYHYDPRPLRTIKGIGDVSLHSIGTEGQNLGSKYADKKYNLTQLNIQMGVGVRIEISEQVSLGAEFNYRNLFTDYLDDVSSIHITPTTWKDAIDAATAAGDLALVKQLNAAKNYGWNRIDSKTGLKVIQTDGNSYYPRGNSSKNDVFYTFQVRLNIKLSSIESGAGFYSPRNPSGRRQLRCARAVY